jgi:hypothetical protein
VYDAPETSGGFFGAWLLTEVDAVQLEQALVVNVVTGWSIVNGGEPGKRSE